MNVLIGPGVESAVRMVRSATREGISQPGQATMEEFTGSRRLMSEEKRMAKET